VWWQPIVVAAVVVRLARLDPAMERFLAALLLALGTSLVLDDPAAATLASSPTTLWRRRRRRLTLALVLVGVAWVVVDRVAGHPDAGLVPPVSATLVLGTLLGLVLASAALAGGDDQLGGAAAGPVLLGFVVVVAQAAGVPVAAPGGRARAPLGAGPGRDRADAGGRQPRPGRPAVPGPPGQALTSPGPGGLAYPGRAGGGPRRGDCPCLSP
jgi:hypothetical protein